MKPVLLLLAIVLVSLSACNNSTNPVTPPDPVQGWPAAPRKIVVDQNWKVSSIYAETSRYAVLGKKAFSSRGTVLDLASGLQTAKEASAPVSVPSPEFTDGIYFYGWEAGSANWNTLLRWNPDGTFAGRVFLILPGFEADYKNPSLKGLWPSSGIHDFPPVVGTKFYYSTTSPRYKNTIPPLPNGFGGLVSIDLAQAQPTATPGEYTCLVQLVYPRTNPLTRYEPRFEFFDKGSKTYIVFAEYFQDSAPPPYDNQGNFLEQYARDNCAIRCVDLATGQELWHYVDPRANTWVRVFVKGTKVIVTHGYWSVWLERDTGALVRQNALGVGGDSGVGHAFDDQTMYVNKRSTNDQTGLEALDLVTGVTKWSRYQYATQGNGCAVRNGVLYVINQTAIRLYRASDGQYLAMDDSIQATQAMGEPNESFVWHNPADGSDNYIVYGDLTTYSFKMNYGLDLFGNLVKQ